MRNGESPVRSMEGSDVRMKILSPSTRANNIVLGACKWFLVGIKGRARIVKSLIRLFPGLNTSTLNFGKVSLPLDLRNNAEIGLFYYEGIKHERFYQEVLVALVDERTVVYDVGSNIGYYAFLLGQTAKQIYAFEPNPILYRRLVSNVKSNQAANIEVFELGISSSDKELEFSFDPSQHDQGTLLRSHHREIRVNIQTTSLDTLIRSRKLEAPDILKIDVEGWEINVLSGYQMREKHQPIIFLEWVNLEHYRKNWFERLETLIGEDYHIYAISRKGLLRTVTTKNVSDSDSSDLILIPKNSSKLNILRKWIGSEEKII